MKYYSEAETRDLRLALEDKVLSWPRVGTRKMYGCPCYRVDGKLFAFLVTNALVVTHMSEENREVVSRKYETGPFRAGNRTIRAWVQISMPDARGLDEILPHVRKSYTYALRKPKDERSRAPARR